MSNVLTKNDLTMQNGMSILEKEPTPLDGSSPTSRQPKLLDRLRQVLRARHDSRRIEQTYCTWVKRYCSFNTLRHLAEMAEPEINAFLTHLQEE